MYYLISRYYDMASLRFINADAVDYIDASGTVLGCNMYAYCENDPVNNRDEDGRFAMTLVIGLYLTVSQLITILGWATVLYVGSFVLVIYGSHILRMAKGGGKQRVRDTGLQDLSDDEILKLYKSAKSKKDKKGMRKS